MALLTVYDCAKPSFQCKTGVCLNASVVCDRINQCGDFSDEEYCGKLLLYVLNTCKSVLSLKRRSSDAIL